MQHGKIFTMLLLFITQTFSFELNDYLKDGVYFYPDDKNTKAIIVTHTSQNTSSIKRLNRAKARLEAINIYIKNFNKNDIERTDLSYENIHLESLSNNIILNGVEVKKTIVNKNSTKIILKIPFENIKNNKKTIKEIKEEIFNNQGSFNDIPYAFYALEVSDENNFKKSFDYLNKYFQKNNYKEFSYFLQNILNINLAHKVLSNELKVEQIAIEKSTELLKNIEMYNLNQNYRQLKMIADSLYKKNLKKLSVLVYIHLYVFTSNDKEEIKQKLKEMSNLNFNPFSKIINMILLNEKADKKITQWIDSQAYHIVNSSLNSYGNLSLNENNKKYVINTFKSNELSEKALFLFRNKKYQEAAQVFMEKIEINPFEKETFSYLAYCLEKMGYQNSADILYFQSFSFDYINNKYTKRIKND